MPKAMVKRENNFPLIHEMDTPTFAKLQMMSGVLPPETEFYRAGDLRIAVSKPWHTLGYHISISGRNRHPSWNEVRHIKEHFLPDVDMGALLPIQGVDDMFTIHLHQFVMSPDGGLTHAGKNE